MKFSILFSDTESNGFVSCDGREICGENLKGLDGVHPNTWAYQYNDEINPNVNSIEYYSIDPEIANLPLSLSKDETTKWYDWAKTKVDAVYADVYAKEQAEIKYLKYQADYELYHDWISWDNGTLPREIRDELLHFSDCYSLLPNLDGTGWESWRVWLRNLPSTYATPIDISEWKDPPANASQLLKSKFNRFKMQVQFAIEKQEQYKDYVPPSED